MWMPAHNHSLLRSVLRHTDKRRLVTQLGVHAELRGTFLLVEELMAGLAQQHEPSRIEVRVVCLVLVVDMQILDTFVLLATEVARTVVGGKHPLAEHLPLGSLSELLVLVRLFL